MRISNSLVIMLAATVIVTITLAGCGNGVDSIKNSFLGGKEQTTVGNAFDAAFTDPKWELKTTENKTQFVEFTGNAKNALAVDEAASVPKGKAVKVQFILKGKTFEIQYAEAMITITNPLLKAVAGLDESKPLPLTGTGLTTFIDSVYGSK